MMITVNRVKDYITGTVDGVGYSVSYNDEKFERMRSIAKAAATAESFDELRTAIAQFKPLTEDSYKETVEHKTPYLHVNNATGEYFLCKDGVLSNAPLPGAFVQRIVKAVETNNDLDPIIKAIVRFMRNPNYSYEKCLRYANYLNTIYVDPTLKAQLVASGMSEAVAAERATLFQTTLTAEGLLNTYKVSDEITEKYVDDGEGESKLVPRYPVEIDEFSGLRKYILPDHVEDRVFIPAVQGMGGDEFYCGDKAGHIIKVGQEHWLDNWNKVNCHDSQSCVKGLHVGNLDYIRGYQNTGTVTHNVFIDPMYIGAITNDGSGALRVLKYFVHSSFAGVNRGYYNSSKYAAITDAVYSQMVEEAVDISNKETERVINDAKSKITQLNLLRSF